jgi:hypothetical protein
MRANGLPSGAPGTDSSLVLPGSSCDEADVTQVLTDYYSAFSTLDVQAILPYSHQPLLLIGPPGVVAAPTSAVLVSIFAPVIEDLRARGYGRSELTLQHLKLLSATAALANGVAGVQS